uniref:Uncharacterized protein n=1 Tax=Setaria viridis TaxID=4556 RepID=A0A4U6V2C0_SETVI|nr:hypothetical protein SEVIR_4G119600v2 [Setaria viridis]
MCQRTPKPAGRSPPPRCRLPVAITARPMPPVMRLDEHSISATPHARQTSSSTRRSCPASSSRSPTRARHRDQPPHWHACPPVAGRARATPITTRASHSILILPSPRSRYKRRLSLIADAAPPLPPHRSVAEAPHHRAPPPRPC